ncbi:MAG: recombination protein O N-terminal domain-containing protein [bacterium]|nr:recombination protein O N-terminal domain-containing protein [bacterium]
MYQKYHTDALVLASREIGESDRVLALYTRDFGLVRARGRGIRSVKSKMRYALQNYSFASISLVKGKQGWRLAGATALGSSKVRDIKGMQAFARIAGLVVRFVAGEEANKGLFDILCEARSTLAQEKCEAWATIELVCVARVLYALGYISNEALKSALLTHTAYADEHLREAELVREKLLSSINQAISETHL